MDIKEEYQDTKNFLEKKNTRIPEYQLNDSIEDGKAKSFQNKKKIGVKIVMKLRLCISILINTSIKRLKLF